MEPTQPTPGTAVIVDQLTLRFIGENKNGDLLHELRAAHVAQVLQGLVGLTSDFDKAGVFHDEGRPANSEVLVRPAKEGSFLIEVVRVVSENWETIAATATGAGIPTIGQIVWWATRSARADVKDFAHLENGKVKVTWQDDTSQEIPAAAWTELNKSPRRRKKQLREIMAPLADSRVTQLDVATTPAEDEQTPPASESLSPDFILKRADYDAVRPDDEVEEKAETFDVQARMSAINFDDPTKWRVKVGNKGRNVTVEDQQFLRQVSKGLAIRRQDTFWLKIREDATVKDGRTSTKWTVLKVDMLRKAASDDESQERGSTEA